MLIENKILKRPIFIMAAYTIFFKCCQLCWHPIVVQDLIFIKI